MSARREKKVRKLEATVAYMDRRVRALERRLLALEELAAKPVVVMYAGAEKPKGLSVAERLRVRLKLWKMKRAYMRPDVAPEEVKAAFNSWKTK